MTDMMQESLFSWQEVELSTDLQRFRLALRSLKSGPLLLPLPLVERFQEHHPELAGRMELSSTLGS